MAFASTIVSIYVSGTAFLGLTLEQPYRIVASLDPPFGAHSPEGLYTQSRLLLNMQERELVIFFTHLEDLELRQSSQVAHWEVKSRIEQLTALSELKTLKLHWDQKYNLLHDVQVLCPTCNRGCI